MGKAAAGQLGLCILIFGNSYSEALRTAQWFSDSMVHMLMFRKCAVLAPISVLPEQQSYLPSAEGRVISHEPGGASQDITRLSWL